MRRNIIGGLCGGGLSLVLTHHGAYPSGPGYWIAMTLLALYGLNMMAD